VGLPILPLLADRKEQVVASAGQHKVSRNVRINDKAGSTGAARLPAFSFWDRIRHMTLSVRTKHGIVWFAGLGIASMLEGLFPHVYRGVSVLIGIGVLCWYFFDRGEANG
jgi:hypothetical protein